MYSKYPIAIRTLEGLGGGMGMTVTQIIEILETLGGGNDQRAKFKFTPRELELHQTHSLAGTEHARTLHLSYHGHAFVLRPNTAIRFITGQPYFTLTLESLVWGDTMHRPEANSEDVVKWFKVLFDTLLKELNGNTRGVACV